jgi:hypothetical protein
VKNSGLTRQVTDSARLQCQIWQRARSWLAQATDSARLQCQIRLRRRTGLNLIKTEKLRLIVLADEQDYVSTRTRSKIRLKTNKAIMSKAHEEGDEVENEPLTYKAALQSRQAREWEEVMRQEWQALV